MDGEYKIIRIKKKTKAGKKTKEILKKKPPLPEYYKIIKPFLQSNVVDKPKVVIDKLQSNVVDKSKVITDKLSSNVANKPKVIVNKLSLNVVKWKKDLNRIVTTTYANNKYNDHKKQKLITKYLKKENSLFYTTISDLDKQWVAYDTLEFYQLKQHNDVFDVCKKWLINGFESGFTNMLHLVGHYTKRMIKFIHSELNKNNDVFYSELPEDIITQRYKELGSILMTNYIQNTCKNIIVICVSGSFDMNNYEMNTTRTLKKFLDKLQQTNFFTKSAFILITNNTDHPMIFAQLDKNTSVKKVDSYAYTTGDMLGVCTHLFQNAIGIECVQNIIDFGYHKRDKDLNFTIHFDKILVKFKNKILNIIDGKRQSCGTIKFKIENHNNMFKIKINNTEKIYDLTEPTTQMIYSSELCSIYQNTILIEYGGKIKECKENMINKMRDLRFVMKDNLMMFQKSKTTKNYFLKFKQNEKTICITTKELIQISALSTHNMSKFINSLKLLCKGLHLNKKSDPNLIKNNTSIKSDLNLFFTRHLNDRDMYMFIDKYRHISKAFLDNNLEVFSGMKRTNQNKEMTQLQIMVKHMENLSEYDVSPAYSNNMQFVHLKTSNKINYNYINEYRTGHPYIYCKRTINTNTEKISAEISTKKKFNHYTINKNNKLKNFLEMNIINDGELKKNTILQFIEKCYDYKLMKGKKRELKKEITTPNSGYTHLKLLCTSIKKNFGKRMAKLQYFEIFRSLIEKMTVYYPSIFEKKMLMKLDYAIMTKMSKKNRKINFKKLYYSDKINVYEFLKKKIK